MVGLDLEAGWAPTLLRSARNPDILPGAPGYVDASTAIAPLEVPGATVDRGAGDVHPYGNPHYLTDPVNGMRVARLLRDTFARLDPAQEALFAERTRAFERELLTALLGGEAVARFDAEVLLSAVEGERLEALLGGPPGGWLGATAPWTGTKVVQDHRVFPYFARRFGLRPVIELEPKPGIAPTTAHTAKVVETVRSAGIPLVLASPYFDPRHARRVAEQTGARVVPLAHQVGAVGGAEGYLGTVDLNVQRVVEALSR
jgi:ABC-type Zn uptake system ZnuABC Zn-binding protein ZnuA